MDSSSSSEGDASPRRTTSDLLQLISLEHRPTEAHAKKCQEITLSVVSLLEEKMGSGISGHVMVAGSFGKGTALANLSDYDIVIFFNNLEPPFWKILQTMEAILKGNAVMFRGFKWKIRSSIHLSFDIDGVQFDLAPAAQLDHNFQWTQWTCFAPNLLTPSPSQQYVKTLQKMAQMPYPETTSYMYSTSLSIDSVIFVQRQWPFIHSLIRLAKYWAHQVNISGGLLRGRSLLIETVAIHASYSLNYSDLIDSTCNLHKAFIKFLEFFSDARNMRLYVFINYQQSAIPSYIYSQKPLVLDTVNPYNNLVGPRNCSVAALKCFEDAAKITLQKLNAWESRESSCLTQFRRTLEL
ncbi:unnamed protein product [Orchesella dallaii]|uniref:Uncharacterized protein n=1 Tax=Orchesella dallaii TaxID=48710 RepID=A0ABP1PXN9_9HEXA